MKLTDDEKKAIKSLKSLANIRAALEKARDAQPENEGK